MKNIILLIALCFGYAHAATKVPLKMVQDMGYVYVEAESNAGTSLAHAVSTTVIYEDEVDDITNSYNPATGIFTAPIPGLYTACGTVTLVGISTSAGRLIMTLAKNGSGYFAVRMALISTAATEASNTVCHTFRLATGNTISVLAHQDSGASKSMAASAAANKLTITRIPGY